MGALVAAASGELAVAARGEPGPETVVLGAGCATAMGMIDVVYVIRRRISPVYLLDAAVQLPLAIAWLSTTLSGSAPGHAPTQGQ